MTVGLHDTFLDLGGDSLSAMLCIARVRSLYGVEVSLEDFFMDDATVSGLARVVEENRSSR
jgi:acyl carrier protein